MAQSTPSIPKWLIFALLSLFWWGVFGFLAKLGSEKIPAPEMQVLFTAGMIPLVAVAFWRLRFRLETQRTGMLYGLGIGVASTIAFLAYVVAMSRGQASVVGTLTSLFPLVTVVLAIVFLRERLNKVQLVGCLCALAAMVLFTL